MESEKLDVEAADHSGLSYHLRNAFDLYNVLANVVILRDSESSATTEEINF